MLFQFEYIFILSLLIHFREQLMIQLSDPNVQLLLDTEKLQWEMGELLKGYVGMNIHADSPYCLLKLSFQGQEEVCISQQVHYSSNQDNGSGFERRTYEKIYPTESLIFELKKYEDGIIEKGQYLIPFQFLIPTLSTGAAFCSYRNQIRYKLRATLVFSNLNRPQRNIETRIKLDIIQPMSNLSEIGKKSLNWVYIYFMGCCNWGKLGLQISTNKANYYLGDQITIRGKVLNQSKANVTQAKVYLTRTLKLLQQERKKIVELDVLKMKVPKKTEGQFEVIVRIPQDESFISVYGTYIENICKIKVKVMTGICQDNQQNTINVKIFRKKNTNLPQKQSFSHAQWNPIHLPLVSLTDPIQNSKIGVPPVIKQEIPGSGLSGTNLVNENI